MKINRESLLSKLEAASPGLAPRELIEQSSCFAFVGGRLATFNDEVSCSVESPLKDVEGAIVAKPLMELLSKLSEDEVDVTVKDGKLLIKGNRRRAEFVMEQEVKLPVESVEQPDEWIELHDEFLEAVSIVQAVAGQGKDTNFNLTCIHLHPEWVEACDNFQACRYPVATGVEESCLIRRDSFKHVPSLGMREMAVGESWVHFRNPSGLQLSCRRWAEEYEDLGPILTCEGSPVTLPGGLADAVDKAKIFSSENTDGDQITVKIKDGRMLLRGEGAVGKFEEQKKVKFAGEIEFVIAPKLLLEITNRTNDCEVGEGRLKIDTGKFVYVSCLGEVE